MSEREDELRRLAATLREYDAVTDAFLAKSFTDHLLVIDLQNDERISQDITESLRDNGLVGANEVYGDSSTDVSFAGALDDTTRHQFVDVRTRGDHQSYVID